MKNYFALCLLYASALVAQNGDNSCCKPCCTPEPKKCINCECYTPPFYTPNGCDIGLFATADFLYWYARESHLNYAMKEIALPIGSVPPSPGTALNIEDVKHLGTKWAPGFRVGLGYQTECDGWDMYFNYTWYHNKRSDSVSVPSDFGLSTQPFVALPGQEIVVNPWVNLNLPSGTLTTGIFSYMFNRIAAEWKFTLNDFVLELGRKSWLSRYFALRPYAALRAAWVNRTFTINSFRNNTLVPGAMAHFQDRFTNHYWGVGMELGFQPEWYFTPQFALISNFDASLLWGKLKGKKKEDYVNEGILLPLDHHSLTKNNFSQMLPIFDLMLGFRWDETWACGRYRTALDLGWEQHVWMNFSNQLLASGNAFITSPFGDFTFETVPFTNIENQGNLTFGGLMARFRFDF